MRLKRPAPLILIALLASCSLSQPDPANRCIPDGPGGHPICTVSLVELISRPEIYDGRRVKVVGWLNIEFEGDALYLHREDFEHSTIFNSLRFSAPESFMERSHEFSGGYCIVVGEFLAYEAGDSANERGGIIASAVVRLPHKRDTWVSPDLHLPSWP